MLKWRRGSYACSMVGLTSRSVQGSSGPARWLTPSAIGRDALIGDPHALRQPSGLPEHVDRDAAARIPIAADAQEFRLDLGGDPLADHDRAILMERAVIAETR